MDWLRGTLMLRLLGGIWRPWWSRLTVAVLPVGVGSLGLTGCVADPPPQIGTATAGDGQAVVTWQPPLAASVPITAYVVTPWIGFTRQTPVVFNSSATTQTVTGLTNGVAYTFTVYAVNANGGDGASSDMSNPVTPHPIGRLFTWGDDGNGQLGDGDVPPHLSRAQIGTDTHWASVATGEQHTAAIKTDGTLWTWGCNQWGQLGVGRMGGAAGDPVHVQGTNWASVAPGGLHSVAIKTDGSLWGWGANQYGQVGKGTISQTVAETLPVAIGTNATWKSVAAGYDYAVAIARGS